MWSVPGAVQNVKAHGPTLTPEEPNHGRQWDTTRAQANSSL